MIFFMRIKEIKKEWLGFIQIGVWLVTVLGTLVISPPLLSINDSTKLQGMAHFFVAGSTALLFIPLKKKSKKSDYVFWRRVSIYSFIACCIFVLIYSWQHTNKTISYYSEVLVKGNTMKKEAVKTKDSLALMAGMQNDDIYLLQSKLGNTKEIWPEKELERNYYFLYILFLLSALSLLLFILSATQSIFCYDRKIVHTD